MKEGGGLERREVLIGGQAVPGLCGCLRPAISASRPFAFAVARVRWTVGAKARRPPFKEYAVRCARVVMGLSIVPLYFFFIFIF